MISRSERLEYYDDSTAIAISDLRTGSALVERTAAAVLAASREALQS
jgi:hypothetical protein